MAGSGAPVMFIPGVAGLLWNDFRERLSQHHTVYALEYPGPGSSSPQSIYQIDILWDLVLVCDEILDALGLTSPSDPQGAGLARTQFLWALGWRETGSRSSVWIHDKRAPLCYKFPVLGPGAGRPLEYRRTTSLNPVIVIPPASRS
jgi:hypothetical protein